MTPAAKLLALPIRGYRLVASPWVGCACRYMPTCSAYALESLERHGAIRGSWLTLRRLAKCHPFGGFGIDNVPGAPESSTEKGSNRENLYGPTGRD